MKQTRLLQCLLLFFLFLQTATIVDLGAVGSTHVDSRVTTAAVISQTPHDPIVIGSEANLSAWGWPGTGSETDPYRIENYHITTTGPNIHVENTSSHILVKDCILDGGSLTNGYGVFIKNAGNVSVYSSTIIDKNIGVYAENASSTIIRLCHISDSAYGGIRLSSSSDHCVVANNTLPDNAFEGIDVFESEYAIIENNTAEGQRQFGLWLDQADHMEVRFNTILNTDRDNVHIEFCLYGTIANNTFSKTIREPGWIDSWNVYIRSSSSYTIANNSILGPSDASLSLDGVSSLIIHNNTLDTGVFIKEGSDVADYDFYQNTVNGKPLGFFKMIQDQVIDASDYGQVIVYQSENITIENGHSGVSMSAAVFCSQNCTVRNYVLSQGGRFSIIAWESPETVIRDNSFTSTFGHSIYLYGSEDSTITGNTISGSIMQVNERAAIVVRSSDNTTIEGNILDNNEGEGIYLYTSSSNVIGNVISECGRSDLLVYFSEGCNFTDNTLQNGFLLQGMHLADYLHAFSGNTVQGKDVGYFRDVEDLNIGGSAYAQVFIVNASNVHLNGVSTSGVSNGILVVNSPDTEITNSKLSVLNAGCTIISSANTRLFNVTSAGGVYGAYVYSSNRTSVENCSFSYAEYGIYAVGLSNGSVLYSEITHCIRGMYLGVVSYSRVISNNIHHNSDLGIGITSGSENNSIYYNTIGWNGQYNAYDDGTDNTWDDGIDTGNWWHDYSGSGSYSIPGNADSVDRYPMVYKTTTTTTGTTTGTSATGPTSDTTPTQTEWWNQDILGVPILYLLGGGIGILILVIVIAMRRK